MDGAFKVTVTGPHPCWIEITDGRNGLRLSHTDLLQVEHAIAEAKRQVLCKLPRNRWHEVDPNLAGG